MELKQAIENRTSVRQFKKDPVEKGDLRELVRLAAMAPSVNNFQPWRFLIITNKDLMVKMAAEISRKLDSLPVKSAETSGNLKSQVEFFSTFFQDAPALIAILMEEYETMLEKGVKLSHDDINRMRNYPDLQSAGACVQNLLLSAVSMGYGACWLSAPLIASGELEKVLSIQKPFRIVSFVAVGKPLKNPLPKSKKEVDEMIEWRE